MDNLYSSFYLYRKYEIIGDELIDLGITSVDADGTQEPVMKEECDPACGCPEPIYRWVQTEDTVCVGEEPAVQYRWTPSGWTCVGYDKYQNNIKEQSLDEGLTWTVVIPEEYSASTLIESQSTDCGYVPPTPASPKFTLTLRNSSTVTAECDSTSSVTESEVSDYSSSGISVVIGDCVTTIDQWAFSWWNSLTSVTISDSVTSISGYAFLKCTNLTSVTIGSGVTNMPSTFMDCSALTSVTILATTPPELDGTNTFYGASPNLVIYVPCESVSAYQSATYWSDLASRIVGIPPCGQPTPTGAKFILTLNDSSTVSAECDSTSSVTSGEVATQYSGSVTPALVEAEIGDCVKTIGRNAFIYCSGLTSVTISDNVTSISGFAFSYCKSLVTCNMGTGVTKMGSSIFQSCHSLTGITIPNGVTSIETWTFNHCHSLTSITIPNGVTSIGDYAFGYCTGLTSIELPDSATSIGNYAFSNCSGLTSIDIPNSVTSIGDSAFRVCYGLQSIDIPDSVTSIGEGAFSNCSGLTSITCLATTPPTLGSGAFYYTNNCPIYVPAASLTDYQTAWSTYASRIQAIP